MRLGATLAAALAPPKHGARPGWPRPCFVSRRPLAASFAWQILKRICAIHGANSKRENMDNSQQELIIHAAEKIINYSKTTYDYIQLMLPFITAIISGIIGWFASSAQFKKSQDALIKKETYYNSKEKMLKIVDLVNYHHQRWWLYVLWPLKEAIIFRFIFFAFFVLFLVFYIATNFLFIQSYCCYAVSPTPEMVPPVQLRF